jgi:cytochrome c-type biogenesis protein CcmH/NrfG
MKAESVVFAIAGTLFGLIVGWIIGSQQAVTAIRTAAPTATQRSTPPAEQAGAEAPRAALDQARVQSLTVTAENNPKDPEPRIQLGNTFFDAERYADAITWYESALTINPTDADVSTDLGVAYYYTNQADRAVKQFEHSLSIDPKHTKTLLNLGIVKAFGKQDLSGAAAAWERVVALAPDSPEGERAKKALEGLRDAHPATPPGAGSR